MAKAHVLFIILLLFSVSAPAQRPVPDAPPEAAPPARVASTEGGVSAQDLVPGDVPVTTGEVNPASGACASMRKEPVNAINFRTSTPATAWLPLQALWLWSYTSNSNTYGDNYGGFRPGVGGAACNNPPTWGKAFPFSKIAKKCVTGFAGANDYYYPMENWNGTMRVITAFKVYTSPSSPYPVQRIDLWFSDWSPEGGAGGTFNAPIKGDGKPVPVPAYIGKPGLLPPDTTAKMFQAPAPMVISDLSPICAVPKKAKPPISGVAFACALMPKWHPTPFKTLKKAIAAGYTCS